MITNLDTRPLEQRPSALLWLVFVGAAVAVEIATTSTWWALVIICARLGWNDVLTARWLWHADPNSARGRACAWALVASGIWKATAAAVAAIPLAAVMESFRANPRVVELLATSGITLIVGATSCLVAGVISIWQARRIGCRLWVQDALHAARRRNEWPIALPEGSEPVNRLRIVLSSSAGAVGLLLVITSMCLAPLNPLVQTAGLVMIWVVPVVTIVALHWYSAPAMAWSPVECWPEMLVLDS